MANRFSSYGLVGIGHVGFSPTTRCYRWTPDDEKANVKQMYPRSVGTQQIMSPSATPVRRRAAYSPTPEQPTSTPELPTPTLPQTESTHIHDLPEEILLTIFGLLDLVDLARSVVPVCSHWYRLGRDESLWARETLRFDPLSESPEDFICALSTAPALKALEYISDDRKTRQDIGEALAQGCSRISSLRLLQWHQTPALLRKVLEHLAEHIQRLEIFLPDLTILIPISHMDSLQHLILHGEISYLTDLLLKLGTGCHLLTTLDLGGLRFNDIFQLDSLMEAVVRGHADCLVSLKLPPNLTSARVLDAVALCTKLKVLGIWITPHITTAILTKALSNLELESLTWRNYDAWLDSVELAQFILYSDQFLKLSEFRLIDCIDMDDGLATAIAHRSQNLLNLSLHRSELSAEGLHEIITHAQHLLSLDVYKNASFSIEHLQMIPVYLPELSTLDIRGCYSIRSASRDVWEDCLFALTRVNVKFD